ncbi:lipocalin family protein [Tenacibaculum aiptasiae]|uniref:lipocalin family protein n=1 Tax=Tenacibaculum aiptasiae TaxID=426481 RepID=UPI00232C1144|nr:lipocalin family protein [Tenacibaculum aiptasiae]
MKKTILKTMVLAISSLYFTSCSSSDEEPTSNLELSGIWKYQQKLVDGVDKLDDCQRKSTSNIKANGTFESTFYLETNGDCKIDDNVNGSWKRIDENKFKVVGKDVTINLINANKYELLINNQSNYKEVWIKQ